MNHGYSSPFKEPVRAIGQQKVKHPFSGSTLTEIWMWESSLFHMPSTVL